MIIFSSLNVNAINGFAAESRRRISTSSGFDGNLLSSSLVFTEGLWSFGDSEKKIKSFLSHFQSSNAKTSEHQTLFPSWKTWKWILYKELSRLREKKSMHYQSFEGQMKFFNKSKSIFYINISRNFHYLNEEIKDTMSKKMCNCLTSYAASWV